MLRRDASSAAVLKPGACLNLTAKALFIGLMATQWWATQWLAASEPPSTPNPASVPVSAASPIANKLFREASAEFNRQRFDRAAARFQQFLDRYPQDPLASYAGHYIGLCSLKQGELKDAVSMFAKVVRSDGAGAIQQESLLNFGWCLYTLGSDERPESLKQAETVFRLYRERYPHSGRLDESYFLHGETLYKQQQYADAAPMYRAVVDNYPDSPRRPDALFALALAERELGHKQVANRYFEELLAKYPQDRRTGAVYFEVAERSFEAGQYERAAKLYGKIAHGHPQADLALVRRAVCLGKQGQHAEAAALYRQLSREYPNSAYATDAWLAAGHHFVWAQKYDEAINCLSMIVDTDLPEASKAQHWLVRCHLETGQPNRALAVAEAALKRDPAGVVRHNLLLDRADSLAAITNRHNEAFVAYAEALAEAQLPVFIVRSLQGLMDASRTDKQYEYIIKVADQAVKNQSDNDVIVGAKVAMAAAHMNLGNTSETSRLYRELLDNFGEHPLVPDWVTNVAWSLVLKEEYDEALATLSDYASEFDSESLTAEADLIRGFSLAKLDRFDEAVAPLEKVVRLVPGSANSADAMEALARCYRRLANWEQADETVRRLLEQDPGRRESTTLQLDLAEIAFYRGNESSAVDFYQHIINDDSDPETKASGLHRLAWINIRQTKVQHAITLLDRLMVEHPQHKLGRQAQLDRARCYQLLNQHDDAIEDLWAFLDSKPGSDKLEATAVFALGISFIHENRTEDALVAFATIRDTYPKFARADEAIYQLGALSHKLGKSDEAMHAFERLLSDHPHSDLAASAEYHLGQLKYDHGDDQAAIQHFRRAIELGTSSSFMIEAHYRLGWAYYRNADFDLAIDAFQTQRTNYPSGEFAHEGCFMLAESLFSNGDWSTARTLYDQVIDHDETTASMQVVALLHGGQAALELGDFRLGANLLQRIVREHGDSEYRALAELSLGECRTQQEQFVSAVHHFETAANRGTPEETAQARYELAKLYVRREQHGRAIREFLSLMHGYDGEAVTARIRALQSKAGQAAAECATVMAANAEVAEDRDQQLERAARYWRYVVEVHPDSAEATAARQRMEEFVALGATDGLAR